MFTNNEGVAAITGGLLLGQTWLSKFFDGKREKRFIDSQVRLRREDHSSQRSDWQAKETLDAAKHIYRYVAAWANHAGVGARLIQELSQGGDPEPSIPPDLPSDNSMEIATLAILANLQISEEFYGFTARCQIFENAIKSALNKISSPQYDTDPEVPLDDMIETVRELSLDISHRASRFQQLINKHFRIVGN